MRNYTVVALVVFIGAVLFGGHSLAGNAQAEGSWPLPDGCPFDYMSPPPEAFTPHGSGPVGDKWVEISPAESGQFRVTVSSAHGTQPICDRVVGMGSQVDCWPAAVGVHLGTNGADVIGLPWPHFHYLVIAFAGSDVVHPNGTTGATDLQVYMGSGDDELTGGSVSGSPGPYSAVVFGGSGDDKLIGGLENDIFLGGDDTDFLDGNGGSDQLFTEAGNSDPLDHQYIYGREGADTLIGGDYGDVIYGAGGSDLIFGGAGEDWLHGGTGIDRMCGQDGPDVLYGDEHSDEMYGDEQNDHLYGGDGFDIMVGGSGADYLFSQGDGAHMITTDCAEGDELTGYGVAVDIFEYDSRDTTFMVEQHDIQYFTQCQ